MIHIDSKKLGRIADIGHRITGKRLGQSGKRGMGWGALHVAADDRLRLAYTEVLSDENKESATAFLERALGFSASHGVKVQRGMTDNGSAYKNSAFKCLLAAANVVHKHTRPYTPRTNGKAERFIQTSLRQWAYAMPYETSHERTSAMPAWLCDYNSQGPLSALAEKSPISRITKDNRLGNDNR